MKFFARSSAAATDLAADVNLDRRVQPDRRQSATNIWGAFPRAGQRMRDRRTTDHRRPYFVDRFSTSMFIIILLLIFASLVDAVLTIQLIEAGASEVNPLMQQLLEYGVMCFLIGKYVLTVAGLPLLLIFKNYYLFGTRFRVGHLLPAAVLLYVVLISYQLVLMHKYVA